MMSVKPVQAKQTRREANLDATRAHIVAAAGRLFLSQGYGRTTVTDIAREAGVAVQTLYNAVGNKAALLVAVFDETVSGDRARPSVPDLLGERTRAAPDARSVIRLLADWFVEVHPRMGPMWRVIEQAAAHDDDVAASSARWAHRRLDNYVKAAAALAQATGSASSWDLEDAAALIWSVGHPRVYRTLVEERGWSPERYRRWVEHALEAALVGG